MIKSLGLFCYKKKKKSHEVFVLVFFGTLSYIVMLTGGYSSKSADLLNIYSYVVSWNLHYISNTI